MELLHKLTLGFGVALQPGNLPYALLGCLLGTLLRLLPGIGPLAAMAMLLPAALALPPAAALFLLAGLYGAAQCFGTSRVFFLVGCGATLALAVVAPWLADLVQPFGAAEYLALMVLALAAAVAFSSGSLLKALGLVLLGLLLGLVGVDRNTGVLRFALDIPELGGGIALAAMAMGLFAYGEVIGRLVAPAAVPPPQAGAHGPGKSAWRRDAVGQTLAQSGFLPLLALGLPANAAMALVLGAMALHNIPTGPQLPGANPELFWGLLASMLIGNLLLVLLQLPGLALARRLQRLPYRCLFAAILLVCAVGAYASRHSVLDVWMLAGFGVAGYGFKRLDMAPAPLLMGFVLAPAMEARLRQALQLAHGDWSVFVMRPMSAGMLVLALLLPLLLFLPAIQKRRAADFMESRL